LILGVANKRSIAWGIAKAAAREGARLVLTYQGDRLRETVTKLAGPLEDSLVLCCDVGVDEELDRAFAAITERYRTIDFIVHAIAFARREELEGEFLATSRDGFKTALDVSTYSLTAVAQRAAAIMPNGGSILTMTYLGGQRVVPHYNVMGVAKAALEASVRYLAGDLGKHGIRVNALSAGPMRTLAGAGVSDGRYVYNWTQANAPLRRNPLLEEVGHAGLYLISPLSGGVTGEIHSVDCGYRIVGMGVVPGKA
jgi:enoyl-[acyl-carrier protein] reductase I